MPDTTDTALVTALKGLLSSFPGAEEASEADPDGTAAVPPEARSAAQRARAKYDSTLRWVLSIFSAVGLLVFGSIPFVELGGVDGPWPWIGLGAAALGLVVVLLASAAALELQDASLGELARTFQELPATAKGSGVLASTRWKKGVCRRGARIWLRLHPVRAANGRLWQVLEGSVGDEGQAHLGPGVTTVTGLIERLGDLERQCLLARFGWNGGDPNPEGAPAAVAVPVAPVPAAVLAARRDLARDEVDRWAKVLAELRSQLPTDASTAPPELTTAITAAEARYVGSIGLLAPVDDVEVQARVAALEELRQRYADHRTLVLNESLVAQLRGRFRLTLAQISVGALLTAAGGLVYAYQVTNQVELGSVDNPVGVILRAESSAWKEFRQCSGSQDQESDQAEVISPAVLITSQDSDGRQDGPFSFVAMTGGCAGQVIDVPEGDGTYAAVEMSPPAAPGEPTASPAASDDAD